MNQSNTVKKRLKKIDLDVLNRLISTLYENVREKKTNIARNSKISYDKCVLYLDVLETIDFVKRETSSSKYEMFSLTIAGIKYSKRVLNEQYRRKETSKFAVT